MSKRSEVTNFIADAIDKILPDGFNKKQILDFLNQKTDKEFEEYLINLKSGKERLTIIAPNGREIKLDLERNFKVAKEYNIDFFKRIWFDTPDGKGRYLSEDKYMVVKLPVRRQAQLLVKKISIPEDNKSIDALTGQPAGKSKGSRISYPEVQMLAAMGLNNTLSEFMKYRGGDIKGFNAMNTMIQRTGGVSLRAIEPYAGKVKSTETLSSYLTAMHLQNNL
jgi:virion structural protein